jgi:putative holliday junction resolvase
MIDTYYYLGIDWGEKRIGLAVADLETKIANNFKTITKLSELVNIISDLNIGLIVLGKPLKLAGDLSSEKFRKFHQLLKEKTDVKIVLFDERLSTHLSKKLNFLNKAKYDKDQSAACLILQSYLDSSN